MRCFFDTEFIEDGRTIDLLSIGIAAEDGRTYYAECAEADRSAANVWVRENVLPHLSGPVKSRLVIAREVRDFVGHEPEFWAYYADYDWVALCQLYGTMMDLPKGWPMFCLDVQQIAHLKPNRPPKPLHGEGHHNALADAIWARGYWQILTGERA